MKLLRSLLGTLSAFILGVALACSINPALADITYQVASFLASTTYAIGDTFNLRYPRLLNIYPQTADGTDNGAILLTGGGNTGSAGRGAEIYVGGNEYSNGIIRLNEGSNAGGIHLQSGYADLLLATSGSVSVTTSFTSSATGSLGWSVVDQADNQACTTGCTSAAVFGINLAAGATAPVIVGPSDATADVCLCAGGS